MNLGSHIRRLARLGAIKTAVTISRTLGGEEASLGRSMALHSSGVIGNRVSLAPSSSLRGGTRPLPEAVAVGHSLWLLQHNLRIRVGDADETPSTGRRELKRWDAVSRSTEGGWTRYNNALTTRESAASDLLRINEPSSKDRAAASGSGLLQPTIGARTAKQSSLWRRSAFTGGGKVGGKMLRSVAGERAPPISSSSQISPLRSAGGGNATGSDNDGGSASEYFRSKSDNFIGPSHVQGSVVELQSPSSPQSKARVSLIVLQSLVCCV